MMYVLRSVVTGKLHQIYGAIQVYTSLDKAQDDMRRFTVHHTEWEIAEVDLRIGDTVAEPLPEDGK